jgi:hypothetical protein
MISLLLFNLDGNVLQLIAAALPLGPQSDNCPCPDDEDKQPMTSGQFHQVV